MRASTLTTILFASACGSAQPTTPTQPAAPLRASIDGKPFVARSALMTEVNGKAHLAIDPTGREVTVSTIYVFERVVTCGEISHLKDRARLTLADNEHGIQIDVMGKWPLARGQLVTSKTADAAVQTGESRTDVEGTVTIVESTRTSAVISLDLKNPYSNDGAHGDVRLTICW